MDPVGMESLLAKLNAARESLSQGAGAVAGAGSMGIGNAAPAKSVDFGSLLKASVDGVDRAQVQSSTLAQRFQLGDPKVSLEETMVAVQKASLSFQQLVQIRNRVIAAYHDVMNIQV
jgi:flagellar hook-basal body complex protein FliE